MNHLSGTGKALQVPYLCADLPICDENSFSSYPKDCNIQIFRVLDGDLENDAESKNLAAFLQEWLFFGLLRKVLGPSGIVVEEADFCQDPSEKDGDSIGITTERLPRYVIYWMAKEAHEMDWDRKEKIWNNLASAFSITETVVNDLVSWRSERYQSEVEGRSEVPVLDAVILSIILLWEYLHEPAIIISQSYTVWKPAWKLDNATRQLLICAGWCPGEISVLHNKFTYRSALYLTSSFDRRQLQKDHTGCTPKVCRANLIENNFYKIRHVSDECVCESMGEEIVPRLVRLLDDGYIPQIRMLTGSFDQPQLVASADEATPYVAISHVWSDGLGNPQSNSLPTCQLLRLQSLVNALYEEASWPVPFWLDTICVPLLVESRKKAISNMSETYRSADKVLVLDSWLMRSRLDHNRGELNTLKVKSCTWTQRLWTLQESMMAREARLCFLSFNGPVSEYRLRDGSFKPSDRQPTLDMVSKCIGTEHDTLQKRYPEIRNIILGMVHRVHQILESPDEHEQDMTLLRELNSWYRNPLCTWSDGRDSFSRLRPLERLYPRPSYRLNVNRYPMVGHGMTNRSTSKADDEPICLATLLGQDVKTLLDEPSVQKRMKMIAADLQAVSPEVLWARVPRIDEDGFRWAARTFLTLGKQPTPGSVSSKRAGTVTPEGLRVSLEGVSLRTSMTDINIVSGRLFNIILCDRVLPVTVLDLELAFSKIDRGSEPLAILLKYPAEDLESRAGPGALVRIRSVVEGVQYVTFVAVVQVGGQGTQTLDESQKPVSGILTGEETWCVG